MGFKQLMEMVGSGVDFAGVLATVGGLVLSTITFLRRFSRTGIVAAYKEYRQNIGRAILVGLELLVAGDIIRTVAVEPTLQSVFVLGVIVMIRTFLSMALQLELEGRWPWRSSAPRPQ